MVDFVLDNFCGITAEAASMPLEATILILYGDVLIARTGAGANQGKAALFGFVFP